MKKFKDYLLESQEVMDRKIYKIIEDEVDDVISDLESDYDWSTSGPKKMDSWLMNFNDADSGVIGAGILPLNRANDYSYLPKSIEKKADKIYNDTQDDATKEWIRDNSEELADLDIKTKDISYSELYDMGEEELAEDLDGFVQGYMEEIFKATIQVNFYSTENGLKGEDEDYIVISAIIVLDSGYAQELYSSYSSNVLAESKDEKVIIDKNFKKNFSKAMKKASKIFA